MSVSYFDAARVRELASDPARFPVRTLMAGLVALLSLTTPISARDDIGGTAAVHARQPANGPEAGAFGSLPLAFEVNQGQSDPQVRFLARGNGYTLFVTAGEAVVSMRGAGSGPSATGAAPQVRRGVSPPPNAVVRFIPVGGNSEAQVIGAAALPGTVNSLMGGDPALWRSNIPTYARVTQVGVYPGIDLTWYGNGGSGAEYDVTLAPGADPGAFRLRIGGAIGPLRVDSGGDLVATTAVGPVIEQPPVAYQDVGGKRRSVAAGYALRGPDQIGFSLGPYDHSRALVIDPIIGYSTFLGGPGGDQGNGIALDSSGSAYVVGSTESATFPGVTASSIQPTSTDWGDVFVTKLSPQGTATVYSTFLGGSKEDGGAAIAVDAAGAAYITGSTASPTFPGVTPASIQPTNGGGPYQADMFVTKLNSSGTGIVYSTFMGAGGFTAGAGIAVDGSGSAYITGSTAATSFPGVSPASLQPSLNGNEDGFVTKLAPSGTAVAYATYLGGAPVTRGNAIAVDGAGSAYVTGETSAPTFPGVTPSALQPSRNGRSDGFVTKLAPAGNSAIYSTYLGGSGDDLARGIAVDGSGDAFVAGLTSSADFPGVSPSSLQPTPPGGGYDAFVTKLSPPGTSLMYSTYLGGTGLDGAAAIAVDASGSAYVTGYTQSSTFTGVTGYSIQSSAGGGFETSFLTKIAPSGAAAYSTFLGGVGSAAITDAHGIAADGAGDTFVTGMTTASNLPGVTAGSLQPNRNGSQDGFVIKISTDAALAGVVGDNHALFSKRGDEYFTPLDGLLVGAPALVPIVVESGVSVPLYFAVSGDHRLYVRDPTHPWQDLVPGRAVGCLDNPAAVATGAGTLALTVACEGMDHALYFLEATFVAGSLPVITTDFKALGGQVLTGPAVAALSGKVTFFAEGLDHVLYTRTAAASSIFEPLNAACIGHPAVATAGSVGYAACQGLDGGLYFSKNTGAGWSPFAGAGGQLIDGVGIAAGSAGATIYVEGTNRQLFHTTIDLLTNTATVFVDDGGILRYGAAAAGL